MDCGSEDDTVRVAREHGARVEHHAFAGFGAQKNFALSLASGEWVLSVDADERVSPALAAEIAAAIGEKAADGYEMPRSSSFLGRAMRHSGWYPDYVLRVFRRGRARFSDDIVHERVVCEGPVRRLKEPLLHFPVDRIEDALSRMDRYSSAGAEQMVASGRRVTFASGFLHGFWTFVRTYVLRAGFLDGREGLLLAIANAEGALLSLHEGMAAHAPRQPRRLRRRRRRDQVPSCSWRIAFLRLRDVTVYPRSCMRV